jgi:hypothetical protein
MTWKPHKYGIEIYQLCEAKHGFVCNMEVYASAHKMDGTYITAFIVMWANQKHVAHSVHELILFKSETFQSLVDREFKDSWDRHVKS